MYDKTIIGAQYTEFDTKDGNHIAGYTLYVTYANKKVAGVCAERIFATSRKFDFEFTSPDSLVGRTVSVLYNRYGKVDLIRER